MSEDTGNDRVSIMRIPGIYFREKISNEFRINTGICHGALAEEIRVLRTKWSQREKKCFDIDYYSSNAFSWARQTCLGTSIAGTDFAGSESKISPVETNPHPEPTCYRIEYFKGTVARDYRPLVFFNNRPHMGLWFTPLNIFEFGFECMCISAVGYSADSNFIWR